MIFLFTDFGAADLYVGQVRAAIHQRAPDARVVDLLHEAPAFDARAGAHLLAALATQVPPGGVVMAVVDPGVGSARRPLAVLADDRWYVGPDNGLLSVAAARAGQPALYAIGWRPERLSASFHGRDLFAPVAAMLARGARREAALASIDALDVDFGGEDLAEVIYVDHYGNAMTGLRAASLGPTDGLVIGARRIPRARVFGDVGASELFWYENSIGLAEVAANRAGASARLALDVGTAVEISRR